MPTLNEHWRIVQENMDAISRIIDGMERGTREPLKCYSCDYEIIGVAHTVGGRDFCSRGCTNDHTCGAEEHKQQDEVENYKFEEFER